MSKQLHNPAVSLINKPTMRHYTDMHRRCSEIRADIDQTKVAYFRARAALDSGNEQVRRRAQDTITKCKARMDTLLIQLRAPAAVVAEIDRLVAEREAVS